MENAPQIKLRINYGFGENNSNIYKNWEVNMYAM